MTAVKYWDGAGWKDVSGLQGPPGPPGPFGPSARPTGPAGGDLSGTYPTPGINKVPAGGLLATQRIYGAGTTTVAIASGADFMSVGTTPMRITYTPTVDCWWDVDGSVGYIYKSEITTAYQYFYVLMGLSPADAEGVSAGVGLATQYGSSGQYYSWRTLRRVFRLSANTTYTARLYCSMGGGSWGYYQHSSVLWLCGKAWAIPS